MLKYKLLGIDLDGTLLNHQGLITKANADAIRDCIASGISVYFVTGRPYCFARYIADQVSKEVKVIAGNGGIYEIEDRVIEVPIPQKELLSVIDVISHVDVHAFFKGRNYFYTHDGYDDRFLYDHMNPLFTKDKVHSFTNMPWLTMIHEAKEIIKILLYHKDEKRLANIREKIECIGNLEITSYQAISFDINAYHVHKGSALRAVLDYYQWTSHDLIAIGDSENDIAMFEQAGYCIAMGNASDLIKQHCHDITATNEDDGVEKAIYKHILKRPYRI